MGEKKKKNTVFTDKEQIVFFSPVQQNRNGLDKCLFSAALQCADGVVD